MQIPASTQAETAIERTQPGLRVVRNPAGEATQAAARPVAAPAPLVVAEHLTKTFGAEAAVSDLSFVVPPGVIMSFIGPSGCGKTTTVRLMTGVYKPTSGRISVLGQYPGHFSPATRKRLGYMPQLFVLYPNLSVWENLNFAASLYGLGLNRSRRFKELLEFVELAEHRHKLARQLSGGMQRRLALAATLLHDPQVLFLDEPTAGIDPVLRRKFWDYFASLKQNGRTLFVTTQYVGEAAYCDLVGVLAGGRLLMVETPNRLRQRAYGGDIVELCTKAPVAYRLADDLRQLPFVSGPVRLISDTAVRLTVADAGEALPELVEWAKARNVELESVDKFEPPLDDVFVELVKGEDRHAA